MKKFFAILISATAFCFGAGLNLGIVVTDEYMVIGARGGFQPCVYYTIQNGRYVAIDKESVEDPGRMIWAVYSSRNGQPDSVYVDENNHFLQLPGEGFLGMEAPKNLKLPNPGAYLSTLARISQRRVKSGDAVIAPLSAFDVIAKDLITIHTAFIDLDDVDNIALILNDGPLSNDKMRELLPLMKAIEGAGFKNLCMVEDGESFTKPSLEAEREFYRRFGLKPSQNCSPSLIAQTKELIERDKALKDNEEFSRNINKILSSLDGAADGESAGGSGDGFATRAKGSVKLPTEEDTKIISDKGRRTSADILKIVRQRKPGLRHIYNKYLKKQPSFSGKVTLRFTIAPDGDIISISVASSSTGFTEFDDAVKNTVKRWTFSKVKSGNTTMTILFTFSE